MKKDLFFRTGGGEKGDRKTEAGDNPRGKPGFYLLGEWGGKKDKGKEFCAT